MSHSVRERQSCAKIIQMIDDKHWDSFLPHCSSLSFHPSLAFFHSLPPDLCAASPSETTKEGKCRYTDSECRRSIA